VLAITVVLVAFGSSASPTLRSLGGPGRWLALVALWICAALLAALGRHGPPGRALRTLAWPSGLLVLLAFTSSGYSVLPRLTFERSVTLAVALSAAALLGYTTEADPRLVRLLLAAIVAGAAAVAVGGLLLWLVDPSAAVQGASPGVPARWRGIGENPNTISMLAAIALAPAAWLSMPLRRSTRTVVWLASALALFLTILASGSRGALLGGVVAFGLEAALLPRRTLRRVAGVAAVVAVFGAGALVVQAVVTTPPQPPVAGGGAKLPVRSLTSTGDSGRLAAWRRALTTGDDRPVLGYGFGTEEHVFIRRFRDFQGSRPENSILGLYLQLGSVGVLLLVAAVAVMVGAAVVGVRRRLLQSVPILCLLAAALVLMIVQSYIYAVGNVAMVSVWVAGFAGAGALAWGKT